MPRLPRFRWVIPAPDEAAQLGARPAGVRRGRGAGTWPGNCGTSTSCPPSPRQAASRSPGAWMWPRSAISGCVPTWSSAWKIRPRCSSWKRIAAGDGDSGGAVAVVVLPQAPRLPRHLDEGRASTPARVVLAVLLIHDVVGQLVGRWGPPSGEPLHGTRFRQSSSSADQTIRPI
jgi:hypothetical protein